MVNNRSMIKSAEKRLPHCRCLAARHLGCKAAIFHGPGHQSHTHCDRKSPHRVHHARYGSFDQEAEWRGMKVFSGYFDEPPRLPS